AWLQGEPDGRSGQHALGRGQAALAPPKGLPRRSMSADLTLFAPLLDAPAYHELEAAVRAGVPGHTLSGLVPGARALVLTLLAARTGARFLVVVPDDRALDVHHRDLAALAVLAGRDPKRVGIFPALDADPHAGIAPHPEVVRDRVLALGRLARE